MSEDAPRGRNTIDFQRGAPPPPERESSPAERVRPLLWAAAYVIVTTLSFAPTLSFRDRPLTAGMVAPGDVVAPRDLIVPDPDATARRKAEAAAEVLPVYDFDSQAPARFESQLREAFERARTSTAKTRAKGRVTPELADAFGLPIGDEALAALARQGFSQELEDRFAVIGLDLYRGGIVDHRDLPPEARSRGLTARDTSSGKESKRRESGAVEYGNEMRSAVASRLADSALTSRERTEVAAFLAAILRPSLVYDASLTAERRQQASNGVETIFTRIPRGKVIVRRGDEITTRTAQWITAVRTSASDPSSWVKVTGILILQILAAWAFWLDARRQRRRRRERSTGVVYGSVLATGIVFAVIIRAAFGIAQALSPSLEGASGAVNFAIPFAAGPIVVSLVAGMGPALLVALVFSIGAGVLMGLSFPFALFSVVGSLAGIYGLGRVRARSVLLAMGGIVATGNLVAIAATHFLNAGPFGWAFLYDALAGMAGGLTVSMVVALLLPVFEHLFSVVTDIRLLELSNQNLPILRTLAMEAPGSYQHSLMLGHLAEAAAEAIGADALLARVSGLLPRHRQDEDAGLLHREPGQGLQPPRPPRALDERADHRGPRQGRRRDGAEGAAAGADRDRDPRAPRHEADPLLLPEGRREGRAGRRGRGGRVPLPGSEAVHADPRHPDDRGRRRGGFADARRADAGQDPRDDPADRGRLPARRPVRRVRPDDAGPVDHRRDARAHGHDRVPPPHRLSGLRLQPGALAPPDGRRRHRAEGGVMEVDVQARVSGAPGPARVRRLLSRAARAARARADGVSVLYCADTRMRGLNRRYRGKDRSTDVLAFPAGEAGRGFLGDIVISVPYAAREARRRREPAGRELDRLLLHGFLHLMGYDHETDDGEMDAIEGRLRRRLRIADPAAGERRKSSRREKPARPEVRTGVRRNVAR